MDRRTLLKRVGVATIALPAAHLLGAPVDSAAVPTGAMAVVGPGAVLRGVHFTGAVKIRLDGPGATVTDCVFENGIEFEHTKGRI